MNKIIGFLGGSKTGKDTIFDIFKEFNYKRIAFGDKLKEDYANINNLHIENLFTENKEVHRAGIIEYGESKKINNPNYWIEKTNNYFNYFLENGNNIIFTDVRRIPEIDYIQVLKNIYGKENVFLFHIERPKNNGGIFDGDPLTAQAILYAKFNNYIDYTILNNTNLDNLEIIVKGLINNKNLK